MARPPDPVRIVATAPKPLDNPRLLRELAVSLIRASDLTPELAVKRVRETIGELEEIVVDLAQESRLDTAFKSMGHAA